MTPSPAPSMFDSPPRPRRRAFAIGFGLCSAAAFAGCGGDADVRPGDIRIYTVPAGSEPAAIAAARPSEPREADRRLSYAVPEGWTDGGASGMRLATMLIGDPADKLEVTVIPASGTLESNVERWQGQLSPNASAEARQDAVQRAITAAEQVDAAGATATVVLLTDASTATPDFGEAILGAMIPVTDATSLFVKFKGDAAVARRERDNFVRFVSSIRWNN